MIKQLQKNQLVLTEGLDKNRLAITQGFDKMDEINKWDLQQLSGYEAIEEPEEYKKLDEEKTEEKYERPFFEVPVKMKQKDYFIVSGYPHKIVDDPDRISTVNFKEIGDKLNKFNYNYDKDENLITLVGKKPESIAQFKFEDLDKGLVNKEAKDILDEYGYGLPSKYVEKSIVRIERKIKNVEEDLFSIKSQLKNTVFFDHTEGLDLAIAKSDKPQPKTLDLIEKHNVLAIFSRSLNNLLMFNKNIQPQTGQGIYISETLFNFLTDLNYSVVLFLLEIME